MPQWAWEPFIARHVPLRRGKGMTRLPLPSPTRLLKRSRTLWLLPPTPTVFSVCPLSVQNFSQRISLIREVRNAETKENSQRRSNNNNVVIKHMTYEPKNLQFFLKGYR